MCLGHTLASLSVSQPFTPAPLPDWCSLFPCSCSSVALVTRSHTSCSSQQQEHAATASKEFLAEANLMVNLVRQLRLSCSFMSDCVILFRCFNQSLAFRFYYYYRITHTWCACLASAPSSRSCWSANWSPWVRRLSLSLSGSNWFETTCPPED